MIREFEIEEVSIDINIKYSAIKPRELISGMAAMQNIFMEPGMSSKILGRKL